MTFLPPDCAVTLANTLRHYGYDIATISQFLGPENWAALRRGEPAAVAWALTKQLENPLARLIQVFLLHDPIDYHQIVTILGEKLSAQLLEIGVLGPRSHLSGDPQDQGITALIDVQPHLINEVEQLVFSDVDASMIANYIPGRDHVLGIGAASLSLLATTPTNPVESVLDLGTGSGVQALAQTNCATTVVATDIHARALDFAAATFAAANVTVDMLAGPWFEPVSGRTFDRIVANPPFVVGPPEISKIYRDSGLELDGATAKVVSESVEHLNAGGMAHLLGAWVHKTDSSWQARVASWLPDTGVAAWILQRDVVDPAIYVDTWLRDESIDPRSAAGRKKAQAWLEFFAQSSVTAIGFGFIAVQRLADEHPSEILVEEMPQAFEGTLGAEVIEYFHRAEWLRTQDPESLWNAQFMLRPGVAKEEVFLADTEAQVGFQPVVLRLSRTDGPRWSHEVDTHVATIVAGLHPQGLSLGETVELYALAHGLEEETIRQDFLTIVVDLVRHGLLLPTELMSDNDINK